MLPFFGYLKTPLLVWESLKSNLSYICGLFYSVLKRFLLYLIYIVSTQASKAQIECYAQGSTIVLEETLLKVFKIVLQNALLQGGTDM